jgi:hypothetical protein
MPEIQWSARLPATSSVERDKPGLSGSSGSTKKTRQAGGFFSFLLDDWVRS